MSSESYTVRTAEPHEYSEVVEVLISAFDGDPAMMAIIGGKNRRKEMEKLRAIMTLQVYGNFKDRGRIDVAVDDSSGKIVGVCLWNNPESQEGSFLNEIKQISAYYRGLGPVTLVGAIMMELHLLKYRPSYKHWYLFNIGVLEELRGRGIGSKLLDYGTARLEGYPAYLEASTYDSARLYERRGFLSLGPLGGIFPKAHAVGMVYPAIGPAEVVARAAGQA